MIEITGVKFKGVVFDERGKQAVRQFSEDSVRVLADEGVLIANRLFRGRIKKGTGYFLSHLDADVSGTYARLHDNMIVYGLWLEGMGSRNDTTRFKGYHGWRDTGVILDTQAEQILAGLEARLERELNY